MDLLKKIFPVSFNFTDSVVNLVTGIILYVVTGLVVSLVLGLIGKLLAFLGIILGLVGGIVDLYCTVGLVLLLLSYFKVLK